MKQTQKTKRHKTKTKEKWNENDDAWEVDSRHTHSLHEGCCFSIAGHVLHQRSVQATIFLVFESVSEVRQHAAIEESHKSTADITTPLRTPGTPTK